MDCNKKLIKIILWGIIIYLLFKDLNLEENFALTSDIITDVNNLDASTYYVKGSRTTSATNTPAVNGGEECTEFPDVVYKKLKAEPATCKPENDPTYYTFDTVPIKGNIIYPRFMSLANITGVTNAMSITFNGSNAQLIAANVSVSNGVTTATPSVIKFSTAFNSLVSSFNNKEGILVQSSLNSDGYTAGVTSNGSIYVMYPFTNLSGWGQSAGGGAQVEVGKLPNSLPNLAIAILCTSTKKVYSAQFGVTDWIETTSQPMTCVSADENVFAGCNVDTGKGYYATVTKNGIIPWVYINGSSSLAYISVAKNFRAIGINKDGKLIACKDVTKATSDADWKIIQTIDSAVKFRSVCYRGGNIVAAISTDYKLYMDLDISSVFL